MIRVQFLLIGLLLGIGVHQALAQSGSDSSWYDPQHLSAGPLRCISRQFSFTEGASVDGSGRVFFTDQPNNTIWEYTLADSLRVFMKPAGRSNGMYVDSAGNLITCADRHDELWSISPEGRVHILVRDYQGKRLNGPNDVWVAPGGAMYLTDPYYQRPYWKRQHPDLSVQGVYLLAPGADRLHLLISDLKQPNGIVGTPDGSRLYVADIGAGKVYGYRIDPGSGSLSDKHLIVSQGSDGMTLDDLGNLYLCGNGVTVYDTSGRKLAHFPVPEAWTANLCFGGPNKSILYITASHGFYALPMRVRGVEGFSSAAVPTR